MVDRELVGLATQMPIGRDGTNRPGLDGTTARVTDPQTFEQTGTGYRTGVIAVTKVADVEEVEVVVTHNERAPLRVGDVFLKIDTDQTRKQARAMPCMTSAV
jgi:hypothetical protein